LYYHSVIYIKCFLNIFENQSCDFHENISFKENCPVCNYL
jgi:hypothetical protein